MPWLVLLASGLLEAVWAHAMAHLLSSWQSAVIFFLALTGSVSGLWWALRHIPLGTGYAVWTGVGATATALWSVLLGASLTASGAFFLTLTVVGIVGLQLSSSHDSRTSRGSAAADTERPSS